MARILLVEDDPFQSDIRSMLLEQAGHDVVTAATYEEAVERCPDCEVVVLDLIPRFAEFVDGLPPETRVIVLSGRDPGGLRADQVLRKPCPSRTLLMAIAQARGLES
jgi:CheY-like chemotaxis protein